MDEKASKPSETAIDIARLPILTLQRAVLYTGKSASTLRRAVKTKRLKLAGRVGAKGTWTFKRTALDRWLVGK